MIVFSLFVGNKPELTDAPQWIKYFCGFIGMPEAAQIFRECFFFLDLTIIGLALVSFVFALRRGEINVLVVWVLVFWTIRLFLPWGVFRMSRYSLPLYPGIMIMASAGAYEVYEWIKAQRPHLKSVTAAVLFLIIAFVFLIYAFRGYEVSTLNAKTFTGYREASRVLMRAESEQSLVSASRNQFAYYLPKFQVVDLPRGTTPEGLVTLMVEKRITYLAIDRWSPHQPRWCMDYPFEQRGFEKVYTSDNFVIFRFMLPRSPMDR